MFYLLLLLAYSRSIANQCKIIIFIIHDFELRLVHENQISALFLKIFP